jgi:lipopolysaccharide/colanic/teichoic acid biosynthesis glycosyltransferase
MSKFADPTQAGMTGLWQVSGCPDLAWDETVGLDLR